ncbi:MAG: hypothetical protein ACYDHM_02205 [Acidiferrobacterales bacterium]
MDYIAEAGGIWYEGSINALRVVQRDYILLPIAFPGNIGVGRDILFREDYFNSVTRIRRGRLYQRDVKTEWNFSHVERIQKDVQAGVFRVNVSYRTAEDSVKPGWTAVLGNNNAQSHWVVVMSEKIGFEAHYLTLKSKTYFGVLPEINLDAIPVANRQDILQALEAVVEAAPIQAPQPVIDACRNAVCHMITAKFPESNPTGENDLGLMVRWLNDNRHQTKADTADIVNRLHSRAKANAAAQNGTRPVSRQDANLAVDAIAFLLQDFEWAETMY